MKRFKEIILIIFMILIFGVPRLIGLGNFTSIDEPFWLRQSANFYYALGQHEFDKTVYEYHPAVTTMWVITGGMLVYFPEYRVLGQGYLKPGKFDVFMPQQGKDPLQLMIDSRAIQVGVIVVLLLLLYFLLRKLLDGRLAFFTTTLISFSPFFLGHSRLLNHEGMMVMFIFTSLMGMLVYLYADRNWIFLLLSGAASALAQLTKSSALPLIPIIFLAILIHASGSSDKKWGQKIFDAFKTFGIWLLVNALTYIAVWPGMWVDPRAMLYEVYGNALTYAFAGSRISSLPSFNPSSFGLGNIMAGVQKNIIEILWHTTPITWIGLLLGIWAAFDYQRNKSEQNYRLIIFYSGIVGLAFIVMFGAFRYNNPPHYTLTSYVSLDLIAGLGWTYILSMLANRWPKLLAGWKTNAALVIIVLLQFVSGIGFYPYYITYYNPIMETVLSNERNPILKGGGYGEGVDQAAAYLAQKPGAKNMTVMSVYGYGSFSYYFPGNTIRINDLIPDNADAETIQSLQDSKYVVIDYYNQKKSGHLSGLESIKPEKIIWIDGLEFLHIYRTADILAYIATINQ